MAVKPKNKMTIAERAKQFMPFSPLKGLEDALAKKEQEFVSKRDLSEEESSRINSILLSLNVNENICVTYNKHGENHTVSGEIKSMDKVLRNLEIDGRIILFEDIINIKEKL